MNDTDLKIGKLVQTVLKPLIINKATINEVMQMQNLEYSKSTFGIQYPLLLKTSSPVAEKHYYSELFTLYGETYRLCCEWFETATNNDRPYVEKWIREHEETSSINDCFEETSTLSPKKDKPWKDFFDPKPAKQQTVILPQSGLAIGEGQYKGREDLTVVEIPDGVVHIGRDAFAFCKNMKEVMIPDSVISIDEGAFWCCTALEKVVLPSSLRFIGNSAFYHCSGLREINIPSQITIIPQGCFCECVSLKEVKISSNLNAIMELAFKDCVSLSSFSLYCQENLKLICDGAFKGCKNFVFETLDQNVMNGAYDVKQGKYRENLMYGFGSKSIMIDANAFDWNTLTIRTFKDTAGAKMAQELGLNVEYVKDYR